MASESSLQLAAQAWCYPATSGTEMDAALAEAFADILDHELTAARADVERLTGEINAAMKVLQPNLPKSGLEDACRQRMQVTVAMESNYQILEAENTRLTGERDALREKVRGWASQIDCPGCSPENVVIGCLMREATHD